VGPCHQAGDTIIHVPKEGVVFAGDVIFRQCTPMGWTGSYEKWLKILDLIISLDPEVIVPGHGPVCGIEGAMEMKAYLEYLPEESKRFFGQGLTSLEASNRIDLGPYSAWRAPARLYLNVERAYDLKVVVRVNGQVKYQGSTTEISHKAEDVLAWLEFSAPLKPGSVMGFGTIPDCTRLDHDDFIDPGADIEISFERLGTLRCRFAEPAGKLLPSRWPVRPQIQKYHA